MSQKKSGLTPDTKRKRPRVYYKDTGGPSLTKQAFKDECDINKIVERHAANGTLDEFLGDAQASRPGTGIDLYDYPNFDEAMNAVAMANSLFQELPANIRERFGNNPAKLVEFMQDSKNADEAIKLGLSVKVDAEEEVPNRTPEANNAARSGDKAAKKDSSGTPEE